MTTPDADCPPWCAGHLAGPHGLEHRTVIGDVRIAHVHTPDATLTRWAIRRPTHDSPDRLAQLWHDLAAASELLRRHTGGVQPQPVRRHAAAGSPRASLTSV